MDYEIKILDKSDLHLYKQLMDHCFGCGNSIEAYETYYENNSYAIWVIKSDGKIIASATQYAINLFTFNFQPCLMLFNVAVHDNYRKKGIGKHLLDFIIHKAKDDGYKSISLTCLESALPAHCLYESVGFKRMDSAKYSITL